MGKGNIFGPMVHFMMVILLMDLGMGKEVGNHQEIQEIFMQEHMNMTKNVDMEDISGLMVVFMKDISKMT